MTPRHRTGQLATFFECEDTTLPAGNPMTTPTVHAVWSPAVPPLVLLSAWLAGLGRRCASTSGAHAPPCWPLRAAGTGEQDVGQGHHKSPGGR